MAATSSTRTSSLCRRIRWEDLDPARIERLIALAQEEDLSGGGLLKPPELLGDVTTQALIPDRRGTARIVAREPLHVCGTPLIAPILKAYGKGRPAEVALRVHDGDALAAGDEIASLRGGIPALLTAERVLLNFLQYLSGIASHTARYVHALGETRTRLLDTRKTTPGFRALDKYAVACGGGWNHRFGLFDRVMIKDNHLAAGDAESGPRLREMVRKAAAAYPGLVIEVEVDRPDQIPPVLEARPDVILLDNFSHAQSKKAVALIDGRCATEASGNVTLETLPALGRLGLDFISCGALTHRSTWTDIALDWD